jgi:hypothetical protein
MHKSFPYTDRTPIKYLYIFGDLFMYGAERYTNRKFPRSGTDTYTYLGVIDKYTPHT